MGKRVQNIKEEINLIKQELHVIQTKKITGDWKRYKNAPGEIT